MDKILLRLLELFKEDKELRALIMDLIKAKIESEMALRDWRRRRK